MTLIERLIYRRLQSADAGTDAGGAAGGDPVPVQADAATGTEASVEGAKPAGEENPAGGTPETEKPADGEKTPEQLAEDQKLADKAKAESVPEKYEFKSPVEGQEIDADMAAALDPVARELGLNNEQAQKLVDIYGKDILPKLEARQAENWAKQTEAWANEVKTALDQFAPPGLRDYLESTGLGNHPDLVRFCVKVGKAMSEDTIVLSNTGGQRSQADILYGNK
jgi:hypothetical protein